MFRISPWAIYLIGLDLLFISINSFKKDRRLTDNTSGPCDITGENSVACWVTKATILKGKRTENDIIIVIFLIIILLLLVFFYAVLGNVAARLILLGNYR